MYIVELINRQTLQKIKDVEILDEPRVKKEINAAFTFEFEAHYSAKSDFNKNTLIKVDGQYFQIARVVKNRSASITLKIYCEHISYELIDIEDGAEEYDGTAQYMITSILSNTKFTLVNCISTISMYYKPSTGETRKRLIDIANLFGGELVFDNYNVSLVYGLGQSKGLKIEFGVNLLGATEEIDFIENTNAYEIDLVDLSEVQGYELDFSSAELGDTIRIVDSVLGIDTTERIIAIERNPFKPQLPQVTVGSYMRDLTVYIKEEEKEEEEPDPTVSYFLQNWHIGKVNCLQLNSVELGEDSILPDNISASVDFYIEGEHKGMSLEVKPQYRNYHIYISEWYEENHYEEYKLENIAGVIGTWNFPKPKLQAISITICEVPLENYDPEIHKLRDYAVKFNKVYIDPLREFRIGKKNVMGLNSLIDTKGENLELDDFSAKLDYHLMQEFVGVKLSLRREFDSYKVMIITMDTDGVPQMYDYDAVKDQLSNWKLPREDAEYLLISISEVHTSDFDPTIHKNVLYGIKFEKVPFEPLYEFRIGEVNCLQLNGASVAPSPALNTIQAEIFYKELNEQIGLRVVLLREYRSYYIGITTYDEKGKGRSRDYNDITDWTFPRKTVMYMVVSILEVPPDEFDSSKHKQAWYAVKFTEQNNEIPENTGGYYIESETVKASGEAQFDFTIPYNEIVSVTLGVGQVEQEEPVVAYWSLIEDETDGESVYTGVLVDVKGLVSGEVDVSMQAVCYEAPLELEEDPEEGENDG